MELHTYLLALARSNPPACLAGRMAVHEIGNVLLTMVYAALAPTTFLVNGALHVLDDPVHAALRQRLSDARRASEAVEYGVRFGFPDQGKNVRQ